MIYVDDRVGSKELLSLFPHGKAELTRLEYADFSFLGRGVDDTPISIGIERKTIHDLITSMTSGRLSGHQLPGLQASYNIVYLLIEGVWHCNSQTGTLDIFRHKHWEPLTLGVKRFMAREIWSYLNTLQILGGVHLWQCGNPVESARFIMSLYNWWTNKPLDAHKSHTLPYKPHMSLNPKKRSMVQIMAAALPGIGLVNSKAISKHFGTVLEMVLADEKEWRKIEGIGKKLASNIVNLLQNKEQTKEGR